MSIVSFVVPTHGDIQRRNRQDTRRKPVFSLRFLDALRCRRGWHQSWEFDARMIAILPSSMSGLPFVNAEHVENHDRHTRR